MNVNFYDFPVKALSLYTHSFRKSPPETQFFRNSDLGEGIVCLGREVGVRGEEVGEWGEGIGGKRGGKWGMPLSTPSLLKHIFVTFLPSREKQKNSLPLVSVGDTDK